MSCLAAFPLRRLPTRLASPMLWLAFFCFLGLAPKLYAQIGEKEREVQRILEFIAEQNEGELDFLMLEEQLRYFYEHPLPLNAVSRDELSRLHILTQTQLEALLQFRATYGAFISVYELQAVPGIDPETARALAPVVTTQQQLSDKGYRLEKQLTQGDHDLFLRYSRVLEEREGFKKARRTDDSSGYLGSRGQYYLRYNYRFQRRISYGFTAEKDPGEDFFTGENANGFDFYSGHLWVRNQGRLKAASLGDYQLQFGQGLVIWSGLAFAKGAQVMSLPRNPRGILPFRSVNENLFLRGGAATYQLSEGLELTGFYSRKQIDGNLDDTDTLSREEQFFTSLNASGLHRTPGERAQKNQVQEQLFGGRLDFSEGRLKMGASLLSGRYDIPLNPADRLYNTFAFRGDRFTNAGLDYRYLLGNAYWFGEVAYSHKGESVATLNGVLLTLDPRFDLGMIYRRYPRAYQAPYANAFAESANQNEEGLYLGFVYEPTYRWKLQGYADYFVFPGLRFRADAPTRGTEYLANLVYEPSRRLSLQGRFRQQNKPLNRSGSEAIVRTPVDYLRTQYRMQVRQKVSESVRLTTRAEYIRHRVATDAPTEGIYIYQNLSWSPVEKPYNLRARLGLFDVEDFNARIYAYENDVLYAYSVPFVNGQGLRWYLVSKLRVHRHLDAWLRIARSFYFEENEIGTGNAAIQGNTRTDLRAQLRFKF